ncbi:hypothetical protein QR680_005396 [Steinernema hermaphroditum]|uniref:4Fe-4S ferredoxin-type domain-containing protein n=1 Tax=Steinernema hermaphroditum TaxID=289476 RepID=A0AA39HU22_9BILA|nr:hypothetical protein QR680_005396 [Steinernema hermaphroditum]
MDTTALLLLFLLLAVATANPVQHCCSAECCCATCPRESCVTSAPYLQPSRCFCSDVCRRIAAPPNVLDVHVSAPLQPPQQPVQVVHNVVVNSQKEGCCESVGPCCGNCGAERLGLYTASVCGLSWSHIWASPLLIGLFIAVVVIVVLILITCCCLLFSFFSDSRAFGRRRRPDSFEVIHEEETMEYSRGGGAQCREVRFEGGSDSAQHQHKQRYL